MNTIRPIKRFDSIGSNRASAELVGNLKQRSSFGSMRSQRSNSGEEVARKEPEGEMQLMGRTIVDQVVLPTLEKVKICFPVRVATGSVSDMCACAANQASKRDELDPRAVEALNMVSNGFADLADANPELAYRIISDMLAGLNEWVVHLLLSLLGRQLSSRGTASGILGTTLFASIYLRHMLSSHVTVSDGQPRRALLLARTLRRFWILTCANPRMKRTRTGHRHRGGGRACLVPGRRSPICFGCGGLTS